MIQQVWIGENSRNPGHHRDPLLSASRSTSPSTDPQRGVDEQVPNTSGMFFIFVDGPTFPFKMTLREFFHLVSRFFTYTTKNGKFPEGLHMPERLKIELKELPIIQF